MSAHNTNTGHEWIAPDDAPELTDAFFEPADEYRGGVLIRKGGRPKSANPMRAVHIRLDPDQLDRLRTSGPGWQSRVNAMLRKAVGMQGAWPSRSSTEEIRTWI